MLRSLFKKRKRVLKFNRKLFISNYLNLRKSFKQFVNVKNLYDLCFFLTLPKRQQFFSFFFFKKNKFFTYSANYFLQKFSIKAKFYKRSSKNITSLVMHFKKIFKKELKFIYIFNIKNFSYRQYFFLSKIMELINPHIYYLIHKQSFIPRFLPKRRIKRKILRILSKL